MNFMTDPKPVSVQAHNRHAQPGKQTPHGFIHHWRNGLHPTLLSCYPDQGTEPTRQRTASIHYKLFS